MDGYPAGSLDHNLPYLVVAGLTSNPSDEPTLDPELVEQGTLLHSELPNLESRDAQAWREYISSQDGRDRPWQPTDDSRSFRFRVGFTGRSFTLPRRRARLPDGLDPPEHPPVLHSPFSPLSPTSSLYPDGLIDSQWIRKHQELVPSVFLCFYSLSSDPASASSKDGQLKADINNIKHAIGNSSYRTCLAVIILNDGFSPSSSLSDGLQERLEHIRRGTGLDSKSFFYVPPQDSALQFKQTADSILNTIYAHSFDYYRDLGRHARKKRGRGTAPQPTVPPTTGTSQTLAVQGWNVRYDFKAAVFAEFRQEMDIALRSYDQAYEGVLSEDIMDILPSWSPRWNEARLLTDIISIRSMRCSLWNGQTTSAVRRWRAHRERIASFVARRGRGTNNYGWQAWESRWAIVMANIIEKVSPAPLAPSTLSLFIPPEKVVMGERLQPWEMLHHPGYWYRNAARHLSLRRQLAHSIPEEDRTAPGSSPASLVASKAYTYDTYMCPEPHEEFPLDGQGEGTDHSQLIIDCLLSARSEFQTRGQHRMSAELALECAKEMGRAGGWDDVVALLKPLWQDMSFRSEGWPDLTEDLDLVLRTAAAEAGLGEIVASIDWELLSRQFTMRPKWHYDMSRSLEGIETRSRPIVSISDDHISSFVSATFVFKTEEGKAGETCQAQLTITSDAFPRSAPIVLKSLQVEFEGSLKTISLTQTTTSSETQATLAKGNVAFSNVSLEETWQGSETDSSDGLSVLRGSADLELKPGRVMVYEMAIPLREPGQAKAASVELAYEADDFSLIYCINFKDENTAGLWYGPSLLKRRLRRLNSHAIEVQPKPPKIEVKRVNTFDQYYTNEPIDLPLDIVNAEETDAVAKLELRVVGERIPALSARLEGQEEQNTPAAQEESILKGITLGKLGTTQSTRVKLILEPFEAPTSYEVTARVAYHLVSDPATPITQTMTFQVSIVNPFEANYSIVPRLHPDPWPSLFDYEAAPGLAAADRKDSAAAAAAAAHPSGLAQKWCLLCHYASFASEDLQIVSLDAKILACQPGARSITTSRPELSTEGQTLPPKSMQQVRFDLEVQKLSLDDRGPASLDVAFVVKWRRGKGTDDASEAEAVINTTTMPVPRTIVLGTEPRVLASVSYHKVNSNAAESESSSPPGTTTAAVAAGLMDLDITIENASGHFLTFGLAMDPSDEFAFSGAKQTTLHVLPVSRRTVTYRLLPLVSGAYVRPRLVVRDKYFQKVLRITPTEGMKIDKEGLLVWVPSAEVEGPDGAVV